MSSKSEKDVSVHDDVDDDDDADDGENENDDDDYNRTLKFDEGVTRQVNILASTSRHLLEGDTQKQVNGYFVIYVWYFVLYLSVTVVIVKGTAWYSMRM